MKYIHFSILDKTLCGAEDESVPEHLVDNRRFCNECIQVMWKEQYRRNVLLRRKVGEEDIKKLKKEVIVEEPKLVPPRPIKSLRHYLRVKV